MKLGEVSVFCPGCRYAATPWQVRDEPCPRCGEVNQQDFVSWDELRKKEKKSERGD